mmetsp:Transcript_19810/g.29405  ORF Transcript_19810/g.29405 Transcript_19810/m.29405 type:complete len:223 (-) Transcript_19810:1524-2192(-)
MFQHPITQHQWCVTRSNESSLNIVISSENYPKAFAAECVEEVEIVHAQLKDVENGNRLQKNDINKEEHYDNLLAALMCAYNDQYTCSSFAAMDEEIKKTMDQMADNIAKMQENVESTTELEKTSNELQEAAKIFKKQSSELRLTMSKKAALVGGVVVGGAVGAFAGFLIGGPGAAAFLAVEAAEVAAGAGVGVLLGSAASMTCTSRFWRRTFVSFGKKIAFL